MGWADTEMLMSRTLEPRLPGFKHAGLDRLEELPGAEE
jgi:hypothetical protein